MSERTLLLILSIPAALAFAFGIWAGLGYPGLYDKYESTGRASRESPLGWILGRKRRAEEEKEEEEEEPPSGLKKARPSFDRGRRFRR